MSKKQISYNREDFKLDRVDSECGDYWFKVNGESAKILEDCHMEMCMVCVPEVVYSLVDKVVGVKRLFPFNYDVVLSDDNDLIAILSDLVEQTKR